MDQKAICAAWAQRERRQRKARDWTAGAFVLLFILLGGFFGLDGILRTLAGILLLVDIGSLAVGLVVQGVNSRCPVCGMPLRSAMESRVFVLTPKLSLPHVCPHCHTDFTADLEKDGKTEK